MAHGKEESTPKKLIKTVNKKRPSGESYLSLVLYALTIYLIASYVRKHFKYYGVSKVTVSF